jgi:Ni,Fe-hydrogenase III large subunit
VTEHGSAASYRDAIAAALEDRWRFAGLHATSDGTCVRALLADPRGDTRLEAVLVQEGKAPSIVDLVPAAGWDEREAHDLQGVTFAGHVPLRPLVDHDLDLEHWTVPVRGRDAYQVAVGPIHAGVIESGHFRFHVVGERILHLDARLFYKHRGLERAAEGQTLGDGLAYAMRACAACAVANSVAYAHACEDALGLVPGAELARVRTILLELERLWSHLNDLAAVCSGVGLAAGNNHFAALTEQARRLNAKLTGHRFLFGTIDIGRSNLTVHRDDARAAAGEVGALGTEARRGLRELRFNRSFLDRLPDIGVVDAADAERLGAVGPTARAAGLVDDLRTSSPRLAYEGFEPVTPERAVGDVQARVEQRGLELEQTFAQLEGLLDGRIGPAAALPEAATHAIGVGRVESPRGATSCIVERDDDDRIERLHLRTGSYANWPAVAHASADNLLPDFPLINKSFELCYACADR